MIEFLQDSHTYLKDGIIVPSVTTLIKKIISDKYKGINKKTLDKASKIGTLGHKIIEDMCKSKMNLDDMNKNIEYLFKNKEINQELQISLREFVRLVKKHNIEVVENEVIVSYGYDFIGTADMFAYVDGNYSLIDLKFTSTFDREYLEWQLGFYNLASNRDFKKFYCFWLPKGKIGKIIEVIPKTKEEILEKVEELKKSKKIKRKK